MSKQLKCIECKEEVAFKNFLCMSCYTKSENGKQKTNNKVGYKHFKK